MTAAFLFRSIPAPAGEPWCLARWPWRSQVYPRACGGTGLSLLRPIDVPGLSPRLRGNHPQDARGKCKGRSIPAPAGEPGRACRQRPGREVYPRACGGTLNPLAKTNVVARSIPAPAGEPWCLARWPWRSQVYPRACGGTGLSLLRPIDVPGLSPRLRGNHPQDARGKCKGRSIPAPAGEPGRACRQRPGREVYPRACGGTLNPLAKTNVVARSIPAPAGEPLFLRLGYQPLKVYPRACGGTGEKSVVTHAVVGLSPRLRGNQHLPCRCHDSGGSIPAPAGEPDGLAVPLERHRVYPRACGGTFLRRFDDLIKKGLSPRLRGNQ